MTAVLEKSGTSGLSRYKLCSELLLDIARENPGVISQDFIREQTLWHILSSSKQDSNAHAATNQLGVNWSGILQEEDILRFGLSSPRFELSSLAQKHLEERLEQLLASIAELFHASEWENFNKEERHDKIWSLPEDIKTYRNNIESMRADLVAAYNQVEEVIRLNSHAHAQLKAKLSHVLSKFPPEIHRKRSASNDLLATTIETSLIKLSLMRARARKALYDHKSTRNPRANMTQALVAAYDKLKRDERVMEEEGIALDHQLEAYQATLNLVDGGSGGGFAQIVEDWVKVQKEKEECKRDLRRMGWTGD